MDIFLIIVGVLMIFATLIPLIQNDSWWIRVFDFPRLQVATLLLIILIVSVAFTNNSSVGKIIFHAALFLCLLHQCYMMFPYTRFSPKQVQQSISPQHDTSFSLLFANVLMYNRNAGQLKDIIQKVDPDIILTAETDLWWRDQLQDLVKRYPYTVQQPQDNTYGMLFYSKLKLLNPQIKFLVQDDIPSIHCGVKLLSGDNIELRCLHPRPPFPTENDRSTERDAELLMVGKEIKGNNVPVVVFGDLNDVAWSRTNNLFQSISGLLDPRIGRGFFNTFHAKILLIRFPLDHFFHSNDLRLIELRRLPYFGSDHFPVYIKLSYEPDAAAEQQKLHADEDEKKEANETIKKVL